MPQLSGQIPADLLRWYDHNRRILPWREQPTPYRVMVSEFMLQQTRVETVIPYFERFVAALPDFRALAAVDDDELAKLWQGLGYYRRARNLKRAAEIVAREYGGVLPADYAVIRSLPGLGDYAAGAVGSIAFGLRVTAVDGNVLRVTARLLGSREDVMRPPVRRAFTEQIQALLPDERVGDFNQALMELGAMVCLPGAPKCLLCPLIAHCEGYRQGIAAELPVKAPKPERREEHWTVLICRMGDRVLLHRRPERGLLAGMWEFPLLEGWPDDEALAGMLPAGTSILPLPDSRHGFTHIEWKLHAFLADLPAGMTAFPLAEGGVWATRAEIEARYAIPGAFKAYTHRLAEWI